MVAGIRTGRKGRMGPLATLTCMLCTILATVTNAQETTEATVESITSEGLLSSLQSSNSAASPSLTRGTIWSTRYTVFFPLTRSQAGPISATQPEEQTTTSVASSDSSSSSSGTGENDVMPVLSVSSFPSLQIATVTDVWWSPVVGAGGPGIPVRQMARAWGKYDKVVVAHATLGSLAWLIVSPAAIVLARLSKTSGSGSGSQASFTAHKWVQTILTFLLTLAAVILGGIAVNADDTQGSAHFRSAHQRMGLVLLLLLVLQLLLGRWASKHTSRGPKSMIVIIHIGLGVVLTAIGFAQIYLGFNLYEQRSSRKVPVAVKVIWAVIVGLFSIYLIALALRSQLPSHKRKVKLARRKAKIYGISSRGVDHSSEAGMSWEQIMSGGSPAGSTVTGLSGIPGSPQMQERQRPTSSILTASQLSLAPGIAPIVPNSPRPFDGLSRSAASPTSPILASPAAAHLAPRFRDRSASPTSMAVPLSLSLQTVHTAPLAPASAAVNTLQAITEEPPADDISAVSTRGSGRGSSRLRGGRHSRPLSLDFSSLASANHSNDNLIGGPRRGSAPLIGTSGTQSSRSSISGVRRKAVPPFIP